MNNLMLRTPLVSALLLIAAPALAAPVELSEQAAAQQAIETNPTLRAAVSDLRQSAAELRAEQARYRPTLLLEASATHQKTPNLNTIGGTNTQLSQSLVVGAELSQTFSWGTTLALRLEQRNTRSEGPLFGGSTESFTLGPGNLVGAKLSLTQPLLRGFGNDVGLAELRSALLDRREQERARDQTASSTLSTALQAYWELWYAQKALEIEREARTLAVQQRDEMARKVLAGSAAEYELLSYETNLAELEQSVVSTEVSVSTRAVELRRALGVDAAREFAVSSALPPELEPITWSAALRAAEEWSYSVAQLRLELERAKTSLRSAADATRPRLDVSSWLQTQGLGNRSYEGAFEQLGAFANVSGQVGVELELPLSGARHEAQLASARIAVRGAEERLLAAVQQARADAETELTTLSQAHKNLELAERTAEVASRQADAQRKRLENGSAVPLEVREAEDSLRRARLSVERQRIDGANAQIRLAHLTGNLLVKWGSVAASAE